jgi:Tfp pilus assembly protein PilV
MARRRPNRRLRPQAGLTIVETMVAMTLLLVGVLGTVRMIDASSSSAANARARDGATNLARELLEDAHDTSYSQVAATGTWLNPTLQGLSGGSGSATNPDSHSAQTTVTRRGIAYTATVSWCSVDDSKDGYGTHLSSVTWCSDSSSTGTADSLPQDLKRITATITYSQAGVSRTLSETLTMSATGGVVAPAATQLVPYNPSLTGPPYTITDNTQTSEVFRATAAGAADMKFSVNGVEVTSGVTNNGNGTWDFNWQIAALVDGTYTIGATAVDALGNRGQQITLQVRLARGAPVTAQNVVGGYNYVGPPGVGNGGSQVVELAWDSNPEGSVTGYEVLKGATTVCGGQTSLATTCMDTSPAASGTTAYTVKTWYRDATDAMQSVTTSYSVTAPSSAVAQSYYMINSQTNPTAKCDTGFTGWRDLKSTFSGGFADSTFTGVTFVACTPAMPAGTTLGAGTVTLEMWVTNSNNKTCTTPWWISHNATPSSGGTVIGTTVNYTAPSSSTTHVVSNLTVPSTALSTGDQINLFIDVRTATGNCSQMTLDYASFSHYSNLQTPSLTTTTPSLATPNPVSGLSVTVNGDGSRTLNWTAPTSSSTVPAPDFYRVYRDGTAVANRYDTIDAVNTTVATASAAGATTLTVAGTTGYVPGQTVLVDTGANQELVTISSVNSATNQITFTAAMTNAHAVGVPVVLRAVSWTDTNTGGSSHTYRVSAVSQNLAESAFSPSGGVTG